MNCPYCGESITDMDRLVFTTGRNSFRARFANPQNRQSLWYDPTNLDRIYKAGMSEGEYRTTTQSLEEYAENEFSKIFDGIRRGAGCAELYGSEFEDLREKTKMYDKVKNLPEFKKSAAATVLSVLREYDMVWRGDIQTSVSLDRFARIFALHSRAHQFREDASSPNGLATSKAPENAHLPMWSPVSDETSPHEQQFYAA